MTTEMEKALASLDAPACSQGEHCGHLDKDGHLVCCDCGARTKETLSEIEQIMALRVRFRNHGKHLPENVEDNHK